MKIKDLPPNTNLGDVIVKSPSGEIGRWKSQWDKGVWLRGHSTRIHPIFVENLSECMEWEIIGDKSLINLE